MPDSAAVSARHFVGNAILYDRMFRHLHMPPELACEFLAVFSRLEYALKVGGFALGTQAKVDPNWDRFANTINDAFLAVADADLVQARDYLLQQPPRKQALMNGKVIYVDQAIDLNQRPAQQVLLMVRGVRNNLFHGGKFLPDGEQEAGRNERLVRHALRVLIVCAELHDEVRVNFEH